MSMYENDFYNADSFMAFENDSYLAHTYCDDDSYLMHYGVMGMHWGQRKDPEYYNRKDTKALHKRALMGAISVSAGVGLGLATHRNKKAYKTAKQASELLMKSAAPSHTASKGAKQTAKALKKMGYDTSKMTAKQLVEASNHQSKVATRAGKAARRGAAAHNVAIGIGAVNAASAVDYASKRKKRQQNGSVSVY